MRRKVLGLALVFAFVLSLVSAGAAYNQMTIYAYDSNGQTVDGVTITVEGVDNDYYEQKTTEYNYDSFFDYTAGEDYLITVEENDGDLYGEETVTASSDEGVFITMESDGGGDDENEPPTISLDHPGAGDNDIDLRPEFRWSGSDPDGDSLSYQFYIEEKGYSDDRPWSASPEETSDTELTPDSDLEENTEYVWGVNVSDGNGNSDRAYRSFTTGEDQQENRDPDVDLQHPNSNENSVELSPEFRWSGSDPDGDSLNYEFYLEERSYDDDRPWSASPESTNDDELTLDYDLDQGTEYVWGVKAEDGNGGVDREYRYFDTEEEDQNSDPDVDLQHPNSNENGVELRPEFRWDGSDPEGDSLDYEFYLEERTYEDDRPWSASPVDVTSEEYTPSTDLDGTTEYVWGVKAEDGNGGVDRAYRYFTTGQEAVCDFSVSDIQVEETVITRGESTDVTFTLYNDGDSQDADVELRVGQDTVIDRSVTLDAGETDQFERTISPQGDSVVKYIVETSGDPCGFQQFVDEQDVYVNPDDGDDDSELEASFSYSPSSPEIGETVSFTSNSYDSDDEITDYRWELGDSTVKHGSSIDHEYDSSGTYTVQLRITDADGNTDYTTREVTVSGEEESPPSASFSWSPTSPEAEEDVEFSSTSTDPDDDIVDYTWEMGDGTTRTGSSVTHQFESEGEYPVQLTVEDSEGNTDSYSRDIDVGSQYTDCSYSMSDLRLSDEFIDRGDSATVSFTLSNDGDRQRFNVDMRSDGETVRDRSLIVDGGDQRSFSYQVSPLYDAVVKVVVETEGEPCNYDQTVRHDEIYVNQPDSEDPGDGEDPEDAELTVEVRDRDGDRLNANVRVQNGDYETGYTGSDGDRTFMLEPGDYDIRATKDGYQTESRGVNLAEGEHETRRITMFPDDDEDEPTGDIEIQSIDTPESVCRGDSFRAYTTVTNYGDHSLFTIEGTGPASGGSETFAVGDDSSVTRSIRFTNVQGTGSEQFEIHVQNGVSDTRSFDVNVEDCTGDTGAGPTTASSISMDLGSDRTYPGEPVKVRGYVDGVNSRTEVQIQSNGERIAVVSTQPDGYYQTYIRRGEVGSHSISATAGDRTTYRDLEVVPTASISFVDAPEEVFQGETFELCADVNSQIEPDIVLLKDGEVVGTGSGTGEVCFDREHQRAGDFDYEIRALTYGQGASDSREITVLETGSEASSFPDQVASVESGSGIIKVELYNTHDDTRRYDLSLSNIEDTWTSQSDKEVILGRGERETTYFYLTPQDEGVFHPEIEISADGTEIYRETVTVTSGGTHDEVNNPGFLDRFRRAISSWI